MIRQRSTTLVAFLLAVTLVPVAAPHDAALATPGGGTAAVRPQCPRSQPDTVRAVASARACLGRVEDLSSKSETTQVFAEPDGSRTAEIHTGVVRVKDEHGVWRDVDLNLSRRADGSIASKVHPNGLVLAGPAGAGEHDLAVLGNGDEQVAVGWRGRLPEPVLDGTKATYAEAMPGVDLVIEVTRSGFESFLVVKDRAAAAQVASVAMPMRTGALSARPSGGGYDLTDRAGKVRGRLSAAYMWDATIHPVSGEPARRVPVGLTTRTTGAGRTDLVLTPDAAFLADPKTEYPVVIDPQWDIWVLGGYHDTWVQSDGATGWNSEELKVGTYNGGGVVARSFLMFDTAPFFGTYVHWATLHMYETWAYSCRDAEWQTWVSEYFDYTTNWWNQPPWHAYVNSSWETTGYDYCEGDGWVNIDATGFFQVAADSGYPYYTLGLIAGLEWHNDSWKRFRSSDSSWGDPFVTINFNYPPWVGAVGTTPALPCVTGSGRPHVTAVPNLDALVYDNEGDAVSAQFEWWVTNGSLIGSTMTGSVPAGTWQPSAVIPAADLADGGTYSWRVRGHDGYRWSGWSDWCEFTVDPLPPTAMTTSLPSPCVFTPGGTDTGPLPRLNPNNAGAGLTLKAQVSDINGTTRAEFEWALKTSSTPMGSVITPAPGLASGSTFTATVPAGTFTEGQAYSWRVRGYDGGYTKPWSQRCEFVVDTTPPAAPTVTADPGNDLALAPFGVTPPNPSATAVVGRPTQVTFRPAGGTDPNIVAYLWGINTAAPDRWAPAGSDGTAVVTVTVEPLVAGFTANQLTVIAVDRAGNRSALPAGQSYSYGFKANPATGWWPTTGTAGPIPNVVPTGAALTLAGGASLGYGVLALDGSSGQAATSGSVVNTTGDYTVATWARPTNLSGSRVVLSQDGVSESGFRLMYRSGSGSWCLVVPQADTPAPAESRACAAGTPPAVGVWTHLAGTYRASTRTLTLYVNGTVAGSATLPGAWAATGPFAVGRGRASGVANERFAGDVADIRSWARVLDATGIGNLAKLPPAAGRWGMDDPGGVIAPDLSGLAAEHDVTFSGAASWTAGHTGTAVNLDGTSGRGLTTGPVVRTNESFTISAWVRLADKGSFSRVIVAQAGTNLSAFYLGWDCGSDRWAFTMPTPDTSGSATWQYVLSTASPPTGTWVHLTGVYDQSNASVRLYVNGVSQGVRTGVSTWHAGGALRIGEGKENTFQRWWSGSIDDVRVYHGVLSDTQIAFLATQ